MSTEPTYEEYLFKLSQLNEPQEQVKLQSDAELLSLFVDGDSCVALERLIERHAPMVASVCRLTVADSSCAEDAFQATFLVLIQSAKKIKRRESVAAWLHGVACRKRKQLRGQSTQANPDDLLEYSVMNEDPVARLARHMELETLNRELEKLPERLKAPLVEHYLLGFTAPQIAERMELSISAIEGRLKRGRRVLRTQLAKRGISMSVLVAGSLLFQEQVRASQAADWTARFVTQYMPDASLPSDNPGISDPVRSEVSSLVQGELTMLKTVISQAGIATSALLVVGSIAVFSANSQAPREIAPREIAPSVNAKGDGDSGLVMPAIDKEPAFAAQMGLGGGISVPSAGAAQNSNASGQPEHTAAAPPARPIQWQKPTAAEQTPAWLAGGVASATAKERNRAALSQEMPFEFVGEPLQNVVAQLSAESGIQFELNRSQLESIGIDPDVAIDAQGKGTIRELLRRALSAHELTYRVTESSIEITTIEDAEEHPSMRFYDLSYVLPNSANTEAVVNAIQNIIAPDVWMINGGGSGCTIALVGSMMIVSCPDSVHQEVEMLLQKLAMMNPANMQEALPREASDNGGMMGGGMF